MTDTLLAGRRILIVEDEYLVATALADELCDDAAEVVGPAPSVQRAMALIVDAAELDVAVLDVNLGGELVYPVADALETRGVPFVLVTGYDRDAIPERYREMPVLEKPVETRAVVAAIRRLITSASGSVEGSVSASRPLGVYRFPG